MAVDVPFTGRRPRLGRSNGPASGCLYTLPSPRGSIRRGYSFGNRRVRERQCCTAGSPKFCMTARTSPNAAVDPAVDGKDHPRLIPIRCPAPCYVDWQTFCTNLSTLRKHNSASLWKKWEENRLLTMEFLTFTVFTDQELSKVALAAQTVGL